MTLEPPPGQIFSEVELAAFVGLGPTPVREAIAQLAREELVEPRRNIGVLVTPIDASKQLRLLDVRRPLEILLARRCCEKASTQERRQMLAYAQRIEEASASENLKGFLEVNRDIQHLKARAAHNQPLQQTMDLFFRLSRRFWIAHVAAVPHSIARSHISCQHFESYRSSRRALCRGSIRRAHRLFGVVYAQCCRCGAR